MAAGEVDPAVETKADVEENTDAAAKAPTKTLVIPPAVEAPPRMVVVRLLLPVVLAATPKPPNRMPPLGGVSGVVRKAIGSTTAR